MKFGIATQGYVRTDSNVHERVKHVVAMAQVAEQCGLDFFTITEQHLDYPTASTGATEVILAAVAATTERIRIRPAGVLMALHHPLNIAERWSTLDVLSNGRLDFTIGHGNAPTTAAAYQIDRNEINGRTVESLALVLNAWSHEQFSWEGEFWQFDDVRVCPSPLQSPHPPLFWAADSAGSAATAGSMRLGFMGRANNLEWHQIEAYVEAYRDAWACGQALESATPNASMTMHVPTFVAPTMEAARAGVEFGFVESTRDFQSLLDKTSLAVGSPEYAAQKLARFHRLGFDGLALSMDYAPHEQLLESIQLVGEEVVPLIRREIEASRTPVYQAGGSRK